MENEKRILISVIDRKEHDTKDIEADMAITYGFSRTGDETETTIYIIGNSDSKKVLIKLLAQATANAVMNISKEDGRHDPFYWSVFLDEIQNTFNKKAIENIKDIVGTLNEMFNKDDEGEEEED